MSKFRKGKKDRSSGISTSSLPDIVFMLLFFFMVSTVMREVDLKVEISQPEASEIEKLENKALVNYVYIGQPLDKQRYGTAPRIQLNDAFAQPKDVGPYIETRRSEVSEAELPKLTTSLKVDRDTEMGIVTDVKQELREAQALKISYSTMEKADADAF